MRYVQNSPKIGFHPYLRRSVLEDVCIYNHGILEVSTSRSTTSSSNSSNNNTTIISSKLIFCTTNRSLHPTFIAPQDDNSSSSSTPADHDLLLHKEAHPEEQIEPKIPSYSLDVLLANLGYVTKINLKQQQKAEHPENPKDSKSMFVPTVALYQHRAKPNEMLARLNYYEHLAIIKFMNTPLTLSTVTDSRSAQQFGIDRLPPSDKIEAQHPVAPQNHSSPPRRTTKSPGLHSSIQEVEDNRLMPMHATTFCCFGLRLFWQNCRMTGKICKSGFSIWRMTALS